MAVRIESQAEPIPGYRLIERLGGGGFGEVWKAEAPGGFHKAIKFVFGQLDSAEGEGQRAEQELKAIRRVQSVRHPYILSLERYDIINGQLLIVMELADRNLWDRFKECRNQGLPGIPRDELLRYMDETAEALDLMNNTYGLQHLDIKPQNLFLVYNHIKVADFGLVKDLEGMVASVTGGVTPVYAAPETFDGWVSRYSDQYSLAIVYQELLTGQRPFTGSNVRQLVQQHLQGEPQLGPLPPSDQPIIARALAKQPEERFPNCRDLVAALYSTMPKPDRNRPAQSADPAAAVLAETDTPAEAQPELEPEPGPFTLGQAVRTPLPDACLPPPQPSELEHPSLSGVVGRTSQRRTDWIGQPGAAPAQAAPKRPAPPPVVSEQGDGILFPALIVGLGGLGSAVLHCLRETLHKQTISDESLSHVRLLYLDTDPEGIRAASRASEKAGLGSGEAILTRLNRPSYYLKTRDGGPEIDSWLDTKMLYRIPRTQLTGGSRALGRLAFCDNYRFVAQRLNAELEACSQPDTLKAIAQRTGLGVRTTRPRVYVISSLAGGSGSGIFLDLAYVLRDLLQRQGQAEPDLVGLFFLPSVERRPLQRLALANTVSALTELSYFAQGLGFSARYFDRDAIVEGAASPFGRCILMPLSDKPSLPQGGQAAAQAAEFLFRDLCTPLGRASESARSSPPPAALSLGDNPPCQTFSLFRFTFPRQELTRRFARRLCHQLVGRWLSKDGAPVRHTVETWVQERLPRPEFGPEAFIEQLQAGCARILGEAPDKILSQLIAPLADQSSISADAVREVLTQMEAYVGRPGEETISDKPSRLQEVLRDAGEEVVATWSQRLAEVVVHLIEMPEVRLAGAEEGIRFLLAALQQMLEHQEPLINDLAARVKDIYGRLPQLIVRLGKPSSPKGPPPPSPADVLELLRTCMKSRYHALVLRQVTRGLLSLRGLLSDELREVNFCRTRLGELQRSLSEEERETRKRPNAEKVSLSSSSSLHLGASSAEVPGRRLFPHGCAALEEAVEVLTKEVTTNQLAALDARVQNMIREKFLALVQICLTPGNPLANFEQALEKEAETMVRETVPWPNTAQLLLEQHPSDKDVRDVLAGAFAATASSLAAAASSPASAICILVSPAGEAGERIQQLAREVISEVPLITISNGDDILIYRETKRLSLANLPQMGPAAQEAYHYLSAFDHFTPHARKDITFHALTVPPSEVLP